MVLKMEGMQSKPFHSYSVIRPSMGKKWRTKGPTVLQSTQLRPGEPAFSHRLTGIVWTGMAPLLLQQETRAALLRLEGKQASFCGSKENPTQCSKATWRADTEPEGSLR